MPERTCLSVLRRLHLIFLHSRHSHICEIVLEKETLNLYIWRKSGGQIVRKMYKVVEPIKKLISVKHFTTSDIYFLINTKLTPALLILFSVLLSALDLLRTAIDCYTDSNDSGRKSMMDNYCWSIGTYICRGDKSGKSKFSWITGIGHRMGVCVTRVFLTVKSIIWSYFQQISFDLNKSEKLCEFWRIFHINISMVTRSSR